MKSIVVTFHGTDRPGLVKLISDCAISQGANWSNSTMASFAGQFCGAIHLEVQDSNAVSLVDALKNLSSEELTVDAATVKPVLASPGQTITIELVGNDRPGIVKTIAHQLASCGANIVKMNSTSTSAPMSGGTLFNLQAVIMLDPRVDVQQLRMSLEGLADELMVDLTLLHAESIP